MSCCQQVVVFNKGTTGLEHLVLPMPGPSQGSLLLSHCIEQSPICASRYCQDLASAAPPPRSYSPVRLSYLRRQVGWTQKVAGGVFVRSLYVNLRWVTNLFKKKLFEFISTFRYAQPICWIHNPNQSISLFEIVSPIRSNRLLSSYIPDIEFVTVFSLAISSLPNRPLTLENQLSWW